MILNIPFPKNTYIVYKTYNFTKLSGEFYMNYYKPHKEGADLGDNADSISHDPEQEKLEISQKMNRDKTGRIFARYTRPEEQVLAQLTNNKNENKKICNRQHRTTKSNYAEVRNNPIRNTYRSEISTRT